MLFAKWRPFCLGFNVLNDEAYKTVIVGESMKADIISRHMNIFIVLKYICTILEVKNAVSSWSDYTLSNL